MAVVDKNVRRTTIMVSYESDKARPLRCHLGGPQDPSSCPNRTESYHALEPVYHRCRPAGRLL